MGQGQKFGFGLTDSLIAEVGGVPQSALHLDPQAICRAYEAVRPVADRLGIDPPVPRLAGLTYVHASTLGVEVTISANSPEPRAVPCIHSPEQIDRLREPEDYLSAGVVPQRLALAAALRQIAPQASGRIGHSYEGPVTTAALLMGPAFFTLPYEDPARAHRLLEFCARSAVNFWRVLSERYGESTAPGPRGIPDDFAGMFPPDVFREFVMPVWELMYSQMGATYRDLHSELLREAHLPMLAELKIDAFDPSVDQYLPEDVVARSCPVPYYLRIWPAWVVADTADALVARYRRLAGFRPLSISFHLSALAEEPKIVRLLEVARELAA
jgi:hypothetical protein